MKIGRLLIKAYWLEKSERQWYCPQGQTRACWPRTRPHRFLKGSDQGSCPGCGVSLKRDPR